MAGTCMAAGNTRQTRGAALAHLFLISLLQELEVAPLLAVLAQRAVLMVRQPRWWGHTAALRVHPGVDVVGDVAPRDASHRMDGQVQLLAAFQNLEGKAQRRGSECLWMGKDDPPWGPGATGQALSFLEAERCQATLHTYRM